MRAKGKFIVIKDDQIIGKYLTYTKIEIPDGSNVKKVDDLDQYDVDEWVYPNQ
jgi:hypothetical protein